MRLLAAPGRAIWRAARRAAWPAVVQSAVWITLCVPVLADGPWVAIGNRETQSEPVAKTASGRTDHTDSSSESKSRPASAPLRASAARVNRWREGTVDFSLLSGRCELKHEGKLFRADKILVAVDGEAGRYRVGLIMDRVKLGPNASTVEPVVARLELAELPRLEAPQFYGKTELPAGWREHLGLPSVNAGGLPQLPSQPGDRLSEAIPAPSSAIRQVQYTEPPLDASALPSSGLVVSPGVEPIPTPVPDAGPTARFQPPTSLPTGPQEPLPDSPSTAPSTGPTVTGPDGSTTGGFQFFIGGGTRSVELLARGSSSLPQVEIVNRPDSGESVVIARGGVTVLVRDVSARLPSGERLQLGTVTLSADRVVGWLPTLGDLLRGTRDFSSAEGELYLEGDIVFRQGDRVIYANSMIYNVARETGVVLDAEAITTVPEYQGVVRVKAEAMRQMARDYFVATNAAVTTSRLGVPRYWLQSQRLELTQRPIATLDPISGLPVAESEPFVTSRGNFVYAGGFPVLYWPRFSTPLRRPTFYLTGARVENDEIFGTQVLLEWDLFQLLGFSNPPEGVESILLTDFLSERGPAIGTRTSYQLPSLFGIPGPVQGTYDSYLIDDDGLDVLGQGRRDLVPEETLRGRTLLRHRHYLAGGWEFIGEIGYLSDRDFLEQYFEQEWDREVDRTTGVRLRHYEGSQLLDLSANLQVNDFFRETERLPSLDHYALGGSLLGDWLTWSMHNELGYEKLNVADAPVDPAVAAQTATLPGEFGREGIVTRTRQELSMPLDAGPLKIIPFAIGEAAHYGEAVDGDELTRLWGGGGVRANLPLTRVDPTIQSSLLNVRGLAHKVDLSAEYFYADSDTNLEELPYYDPLDDNAQEQFRRSFIFSTFGGPPLPPEFDPRLFALRNGIQRYVASPSDTIVDDLQQIRLGMKHRFQTKRGLPGRERIVDLFRFDVETILFPDEESDNFGTTLGPTIYDAQYNLGDRVTLLSDGYLDFFDDGLRSISAGVRTSRPGVGDLYVGLLSLEGPISSTVLRSTLDHRLNEKWIASAGNTYDFGSVGNVGYSLGLTRIGESFLTQIGVSVDAGRDNTSFGFLIEPRFLPSPRLGRLGGQIIPPPGIEGLE